MDEFRRETTVTFADGHAEKFDAIVFGTGFALGLPFLSEEIRAVIDLDAVHIDADRHTFHPDLPGLAFVGMWDQSGGYFVPLELQARWIAYTWGDVVAATNDADRRSSIEAYRSRRGMPQKTRMNLAAVAFARPRASNRAWKTGRICAALCCSVRLRRVASGSRARTRFPTPRPDSLATPLRSGRSRRMS